MKGELSTIRPQLEKMGPLRVDSPAVDENETNTEEDSETADEADISSSSSSSSSSSTNETTLQSTTIGEKSDSGNNSNDEAKPTGIPVYHVDANRFPQVGAKNKIHGLPTLVLYFEGEEIWRNEGIMMAEEIVDILTKLHEERGWSGVTTETPSTVKQ